MKVRVKTTAAAVALFAAIAGTASFAQTVTYNPGDLVIGFQAHAGSTGVNQNFLLNIGSAAAYNNGTMPLSLTNPVANIGDQLTAIYGAGWSTSGALSWGAIGRRDYVGGFGSTGPVIDGDSRGVMYVSREATSIGGSTAWDALSRNAAASTSVNMNGVLQKTQPTTGGFINQNAVEGTNGMGAIIDASLSNSWSAKVPMDGSSFGMFTGGIQGLVELGGVNEFVYLDIYRITPDGVSPTLVVTLALDSAGNVYAVPEPSTYAALIGAAGLALVITRRVRRNKATA